MPHPLVDQLRFARAEFQRGLKGLTEEEAQKRFLPMNCISWNVGHLTWQEQRYWLDRAQNQLPRPDIQKNFAYGAPASIPTLADMWEAWHAITQAADPWLDAQTTESLNSPVIVKGESIGTNWGSLLLRMIYHYWYHNGENLAIRQNLGHTKLPQFVGDIDGKAPYRPE